jgi:hypothetical protein
MSKERRSHEIQNLFRYCVCSKSKPDFGIASVIRHNDIYATVQQNYLLKQYYNIKGGNMFRLTSGLHQAYHNILTNVWRSAVANGIPLTSDTG